MPTPRGPNLVARLTTTFSRQRCRQPARDTTILPLPRYRHRHRHTARPPPDTFYEEGFTAPDPSTAFLEPCTDEYRRVVLPPRERKPYVPPWPTILPPSHAAHQPESPPREPVVYLTARTRTPCEAVRHLIRANDLPAARQLVAEFTDLGTPIVPHRAFLDAALHLSRRGHPAAALHQQEILDWLTLWHAFPPVKQFPHGPIAALEPLLERVLARSAADLGFLRQLCLLSARKGWAPALIPTVFKHYATCTDTTTSYALLNEMIALYATHTPEPQRPEGHRANSVRAQVGMWRNLHLQTVLSRGVEDARMIYEAGEAAGVVWDRATKVGLAEALQGGAPGREGSVQLPLSVSDGGSAMRRVLSVAHGRSRQPVRNLVDLLAMLEAHGRTSLITRLSARFLRGPGDRVANETTAAFWWMAHVLKARGEGRHADAVAVFRERFYAVGLPRGPDRGEAVDSGELGRKRSVRGRKLYPSPEVITAVLPSFIHLVNPTTRQSFAALYAEFTAAASILPTLHTDPLFHLPFITHYASTFGAPAAEAWCDRLEARGTCVGVQGWSVVAIEHAKSRKMRNIDHILDRMNADRRTGLSSVRPNERTFVGIATVLLKRGKYYKAKAVLERWHVEKERRAAVVAAQEG